MFGQVIEGDEVSAALQVGDRLEVVAVGDSGIRINGTDLLQVLKPLDDVTSLLRRETWRHFQALGRSAADCDRLAAALTWPGTRHQPPGSETAAAPCPTLTAPTNASSVE